MRQHTPGLHIAKPGSISINENKFRRKDMQSYDVYKDIMNRTGGDIYIGVVGPVRTGKSTFITRLVTQMLLPMIEDENERRRIVDELPQSGAGRTIMTTQPKFVPPSGVGNHRQRLAVCACLRRGCSTGPTPGKGRRGQTRTNGLCHDQLLPTEDGDGAPTNAVNCGVITYLDGSSHSVVFALMPPTMRATPSGTSRHVVPPS